MIPIKYKMNKTTMDNLIKNYMEAYDFSELRLFIDIKGLFFTLFSDDSAKMELLLDYDRSYWSYAEAVIKLVNHYIGWALSHYIVPQIYLFAEHGNTKYHDNIDPNYKSERKKRHKTSLPTEFLRDKFSKAIHKNIEYLQTVLNTRGSGINVIYLDGLEGDFAPTYIINEHHKIDQKDRFKTLNVTMSSDKDLNQSITKNHIQISKPPNKDYIQYNINNAFHAIIKKKTLDPHGLPMNMFSLALAIIGDVSDSVKGINGLGEVAVFELLKEYEEQLVDVIDYESFMVFANNAVENGIGSPKMQKHLSKIIINHEVLDRAYKLIDFRPLIESQTEIIEKHFSLLPALRYHDPEYNEKVQWYDSQLRIICKRGLEDYRHILHFLK